MYGVFHIGASRITGNPSHGFSRGSLRPSLVRADAIDPDAAALADLYPASQQYSGFGTRTYPNSQWVNPVIYGGSGANFQARIIHLGHPGRIRVGVPSGHHIRITLTGTSAGAGVGLPATVGASGPTTLTTPIIIAGELYWYQIDTVQIKSPPIQLTDGYVYLAARWFVEGIENSSGLPVSAFVVDAEVSAALEAGAASWGSVGNPIQVVAPIGQFDSGNPIESEAPGMDYWADPWEENPFSPV